MIAAQFLLDLIEIRDSFKYSASMLSFNEVCVINVHLATSLLLNCTGLCCDLLMYIRRVCVFCFKYLCCTACTTYITNK